MDAGRLLARPRDTAIVRIKLFGTVQITESTAAARDPLAAIAHVMMIARTCRALRTADLRCLGKGRVYQTLPRSLR